jgi:ferrous iron transport protein B
LLIAAFIPDRPVIGNILTTRPVALLGLYVLGFVAAFLTARVLKSSILKSERNTFVMEMPPYRMPTLSGLAMRLLDRAKVFLRRAGTVILAVTVLLWCLASLPMRDGTPPPIEESIVGKVGHAVEPLIEPLGFNWKIGIGLITSLAAREVIIGTLGTIYGMEEATHESSDLQAALQKDLAPGGAVALLIFFAFAMQCFSTIAVVRRETGGWKWPAIQFAYMTALAYVGALAANVIVTETLKRV